MPHVPPDNINVIDVNIAQNPLTSSILLRPCSSPDPMDASPCRPLDT
ncbi:hypothetical protein EYZ11_005773 [Aspergillus tanneri]|uniref:Uncharacterized protein n=1 Tax=Aspergillus tanneri TaxID=1220188 RepID=A0A4V3UPD5_9EURO|nr:hypothetical protein EYZ11_005773 [Aspergillus tanneri]